jgi:PAS domain S-box-containing protein
MTILLVDDVVENLELLEVVLSEYGFETKRALTGSDAIDVLKREQVHLIISDAMMPKMDGFELCKLVKRDPASSSIPFIIYTGDYVDDEDAELGKSIGVDRYVEKSGGMETLVDVVQQIVRERYGVETGNDRAETSQLDDQKFLERHHAIVVKKLEQKMNELEMFAQTLSRRNRELQVSEARYRGLFEQASIAIYVLQRKSAKVVDVNAQGLTLLGYTKEELIALAAFPFESPNPETITRLHNKNQFFGDATLKSKNGRSLSVELFAGSFEYDDESKVLLFVRDITEQKRIREILIQSEKMSLMGTLASGIAHEIRNPLAAVTLNLQFLEQQLTANNDETLGAVQSALEGTTQIDKVINNTLGLARMTPPELHAEDLNDIVKQALGYLRLVIQQKDLHVDTALAQHLPPVDVDSRQIQQVLINILHNAIEATPAQNAITIKSYEFEETMPLALGSPAARKVVLSIRDTGSGIPPERMNDLFEPFRTTKPGGTGLGLALSKRILDRHGAGIKIEQAEGGGTMVRLVFPQRLHTEQ